MHPQCATYIVRVRFYYNIMELIGLSLLIICFVLFINRPKQMKKEYETQFKVDLGNGVETLSWSRLNHLTESEKEYLFKNVKQCSHLTCKLPDFNTENVVKFAECFRH